MGKQLNDVELWRKYIDNGRPIALRNRLAEKNLKLIYEVISKTKRVNKSLCDEDEDDLFQQGFFGLNSAIERFELKEGTYFYAFAYPFIYGRLMGWLRDKSRPVRIPVVKHDLTMRFFKVRERLKAKGIHNPTLKEIFEQSSEKDQAIGFEAWKEIVRQWHATKTVSGDTQLGGIEKRPNEGATLLSQVESKTYQDHIEVKRIAVYPYLVYPELREIARKLEKAPAFRPDGKKKGNAAVKDVVYFKP